MRVTTKHKTTRYVSKAETRRREEIAKQGLLDAEGASEPLPGCGRTYCLDPAVFQCNLIHLALLSTRFSSVGLIARPVLRLR